MGQMLTRASRRLPAEPHCYFGDTHLHTSYWADAGMAGAVVGPEEAYRFARGEDAKWNHGKPVKLVRPLDFLVIADHAKSSDSRQ
jgi:hypothetical protein